MTVSAAEALRLEISALVGRYAELACAPTPFVPGQSPVPVSGKVIGAAELQNMVNASLDALPQHDREARETLRKFLTSKYERDRGSSIARSQNAAFERRIRLSY